MEGEPQSIVCGNCGSIENPELLRCSRCTRRLLVDLHRASDSLDERMAFQAAKALSLLGKPAPAFQLARERFEGTDTEILTGVSPRFAQQVILSLEGEGVTLVMRPHPTTGGGGVRIALIAGAAIFLLASVGGVLAVFTGAPEEATPLPRPAEEVAVAEEASPPGEPIPEALSLTEIGSRVTPSVAHIECNGVQGAGFFIDATTLITNAHVACPEGKLQTILLADERKILGDTLWRDEWMDLASIRVVGADAQGLELGDATALQAGDPCAFIGSPRGMAFSLNEAKLAHVGREHLGLAYLQFDGSVNPGNSGGPLVDEKGRVVGVVSLMVKDSAGIGLALPVQYLPEGRDRLTSGEAVTRWEALLEHTERAAKERAPLFDLAADEPFLLGFRPDDEGRLNAVLAQRWSSDPEPTRHILEAVVEGEVACTFQARVERWRSVEESLDRSEHRRALLYLMKQEKGRDTFFGAARLEVEECEEASSRVFQGGLFRLREATKSSPEHRIDSSLRMGIIGALRASKVESQRAEYDERREASRETLNEHQWRRAFVDGYAQVDRIEAQHQRTEAFVARLDARAATFQLTADGLKRYELARRQLAESKKRLKAAQDHLSKLERTASSQSVPRHWRRRTD